jgi:hypothetical protein
MSEPRFLIVALLSLVGHAPIIGFYLGFALAPESIHETERLWWILVQFFLVEMAACGLAVFFGHGFASTAPALRASGRRERTAAILVAALSFLVLLPWFVASTLHDTDLGLAVALPFLPRLLLAWRARGETRRFARALGRSGLLGWGLAVLCLVVALVSDLRLAAAIAGYYLLLCIATTALFRDAHLSS